MRRLLIAVVCLVAVGARPAFAQSCIPAVKPPPSHPSLVALPDSYWRGLAAWSDLPAGERDLLARVSIAQRDIRALDRRLAFSNAVPATVVPLETSPGEQFVTGGAAKLDQLVLAARAFVRTRDLRSWFVVGDGFRSYAVQLATWPRNLRKYLGRLKPELERYRGGDGRYSGEAVCVLRAYAGCHYAFPGYSHHQSGRAADFHARLGDGPELDSNSSSGAVGGTGRSNIELWCASPVFAWLHMHAREYGFVQAKIDEPWHWVYDPNAARRPADADYVATSCQN